MLATQLGGGPRSLHAAAVSGGPPPTPAGTTGNGTCGFTSYGRDCNKDDDGAWNTTSEKIHDLPACVERCKKCSQCSYVSLSLENEDCRCERES
jgi:hypothetical protein